MQVYRYDDVFFIDKDLYFCDNTGRLPLELDEMLLDIQYLISYDKLQCLDYWEIPAKVKDYFNEAIYASL